MSSDICPVPSQTGQRSEPVLYEKSLSVRPRFCASGAAAKSLRRSSSTFE